MDLYRMIKTITYDCDWCEKKHTQRLGNYKRNKNHYCSSNCQRAMHSYKLNLKKDEMLKEIIECDCGCGETFNRYTVYMIKATPVLRERKYINGHRGRLGNSGQFNKGCEAWNKGIPHREETKQKLSKAAKEQFKDGVPLEIRIKMSCGLRGISIDEFNGFITPETMLQRNSTGCKEWKYEVFSRDGFYCQLCGRKRKKGDRVELQAHHIKHWADYPKFRFEIDNGITLCKECHNYVHSKAYQNELED